MKALIVLVVIGLLALGAAYFFGGIASMDPAAEAQAFKNAVKPGMTWQEVVAAGKPQYFMGMIQRAQHVGSTDPMKFSLEQMQSDMTNNRWPLGFVFIHRFSASDEYHVHFGPGAKVEHVEKAITEADILSGKLAYPSGD